MRILITNDDGYDSPGLMALARSLAPGHEIVIVAPDRDRSGASHSITVGRPLGAKSMGPASWSLDGSPVDCVRAGVLALCGDIQPDLVVSGINLGANLGTDILLSGTVGAARHACILGIPALAVSTPGYREACDVDAAARFVAANLDLLVAVLGAGGFININVPPDGGRGLSLERPGELRYAVELTDVEPAPGMTRSLLSRARLLPPSGPEEGDWHAVSRGRAVLTALGPWGPDPVLEARLGAILPGLALEGCQLSLEVGSGQGL